LRGSLVALVVVFLATTVFALSNTAVVTVMFWQWPVYTGSLALAIVGAGVLGALLAFLPSLARHAHLRGRVHDLERRLAAHQPPPAPVAPDTPASTIEQTRRLP
jgi:uncharacterized integral membrane protein